MEYFAMLLPGAGDPVAWAAQRQDEGYTGVGIGDHIAPFGIAYPHLWVTLTSIAVSCPRLRVFSTFANNLFRSPVEFAQAALSLAAVSGGRYDAGLGAGWAAAELESMGWSLPDGPTRARRYREAMHIVRALLTERRCDFEGEHYRIHQPDIGVDSEHTPALVAAVGGPWTIEHVSPYADVVEVMPVASSYRTGQYDRSAWTTGGADTCERMIELARKANPSARLCVNLPFSIGSDDRTRASADRFANGPVAGMFGEAAQVADRLAQLAALGVSRFSLACPEPGGYAQLVEHLGLASQP